MKRLVVPAVSALLLAGLPAQAQYVHQPSIQIAQNSDVSDHHRSDASGGGANSNDQSGSDNSKGGKGHNDKNRSDKGGAQGGPAAGAPMGGATSSGGNATGAPTMMGTRGRGPTGPTGGATVTGGHAPTGSMMGKPTGGAATMGSRPAGTSVFGTRPSNWNRYPRQFDSNVYQRNYSAPRQYHWRTYNRPSGWYYQRWVFGQIFPSMFWARDYWITDYWMFDLPIPPYGYVWVRYGDDALLVNRRTGRVLQVIYGIFD